MEKKRILYLGGFDMPDGNAAAQRVLSVGESLKEMYEIKFLGLTRSDHMRGIINGFEYENLIYPKSYWQWLMHLSGKQELERVRSDKPDIIIAYNFPSFGLARLIRLCRKNKIVIVGDITEWYHSHNIMKWFDTSLRMRVLNKKMDGLLLISNYLDSYYSGLKKYKLPPTIDHEDLKWKVPRVITTDSRIHLLYAGSPGRGDKDRLDGLLTSIIKYKNLFLDIIGITSTDFSKKYPEVTIPDNAFFWGRLTHKETISKLVNSDFSIFYRKASRVNNAGFPTKFVEAQSAGVPVISNLFSDLDKYIDDGKNGFLTKSISVEDIDSVLGKVSSLSRKQIEMMHDYTKQLNTFDYRNYQREVTRFIDSIEAIV